MEEPTSGQWVDYRIYQIVIAAIIELLTTILALLNKIVNVLEKQH